jgi:hypothetical protein
MRCDQGDWRCDAQLTSSHCVGSQWLCFRDYLVSNSSRSVPILDTVKHYFSILTDKVNDASVRLMIDLPVYLDPIQRATNIKQIHRSVPSLLARLDYCSMPNVYHTHEYMQSVSLRSVGC